MEEETKPAGCNFTDLCCWLCGGDPWSPINWLRWEPQTPKCTAPHPNKLVFIFAILWIDPIEKAQLSRFHQPLKETVKILLSTLYKSSITEVDCEWKESVRLIRAHNRNGNQETWQQRKRREAIYSCNVSVHTPGIRKVCRKRMEGEDHYSWKQPSPASPVITFKQERRNVTLRTLQGNAELTHWVLKSVHSSCENSLF